MPSPGLDQWMELNNESSIRPADKLAMPNYAGAPYSRPEWNPPPKQHRAPKASTHTKPMSLKSIGRGERDSKADSKAYSKSTEKALELNKTSMPRPDAQRRTNALSHHSPTDPKFDSSKLTAHHAEGSAQVKKDCAEVGPIDRKAEAKKRLEERRRLRKDPPS
jgi:hypothetical protein